jgi:hypothetical protein
MNSDLICPCVKIAQLLRATLLMEKMVASVPVLQIEYSKCSSGETFAGNVITVLKTMLRQPSPNERTSLQTPLKNLFPN